MFNIYILFIILIIINLFFYLYYIFIFFNILNIFVFYNIYMTKLDLISICKIYNTTCFIKKLNIHYIK